MGCRLRTNGTLRSRHVLLIMRRFLPTAESRQSKDGFGNRPKKELPLFGKMIIVRAFN